jgi:alkylation response protein AidB-like acyl-CoA dehydrogenase
MKIPDAPLHEPAPATVSPLLERVRKIATGQLAPLAEKIDREGFYPRDILRSLGDAGAYRAQMAGPRGTGDYAGAILAMAEVSKACMSTGFMTWCQDVCGLYIEQSGNQALIDRRLESHLAGATLGGTGLSNPMKTFSGIETMLLTAKRAAGGYVVNGTLPWVSNIGPGHYFGAICQVDEGGAAGHQVMFLLDCGDPAITLKHCPTFSGMEGTGTFSVRVTDLFIGEADIIADPVGPYIKRIKGAFILLQTGMALGVVQGSIDSMWQVEQQLGHVNQYLEDRPDELQGEANELAARILRLAATPFEGSRDYLLEVLDARAHGAELSLRASQSALLHQGARGYLMSAAPQRRIREAHFVAIVTPAIKHLRREMARLSAQEQPA